MLQDTSKMVQWLRALAALPKVWETLPPPTPKKNWSPATVQRHRGQAQCTFAGLRKRADTGDRVASPTRRVSTTYTPTGPGLWLQATQSELSLAKAQVKNKTKDRAKTLLGAILENRENKKIRLPSLRLWMKATFQQHFTQMRPLCVSSSCDPPTS